jgi:hypothetical protein
MCRCQQICGTGTPETARTHSDNQRCFLNAFVGSNMQKTAGKAWKRRSRCCATNQVRPNESPFGCLWTGRLLPRLIKCDLMRSLRYFGQVLSGFAVGVIDVEF